MYEYDTRIRYSETDEKGRLTLPALLDYYQDCSTFQSDDIGVGIKYCKDNHMIWALSSWQIVVDRYPSAGDRITVGTSPYEFKGFIGYRNFVMKDEKGERISVANSVWALIDDRDGKPVMPTEKMMEAYVLSEKMDMDYAPRKIKISGEKREGKKITVMPHHLDGNHHVNNGQYVRMGMDYLPADLEIHQLRAEYKAQAFLGDEIYPFIYEDEGKTFVSLCDKEENAYCNMEFLLRRDNA